MAADDKPFNAELKRNEQLQRWKDSDTDIEQTFPKRKKTAVQFQDGCVFLAACSSGDTDEVEKLLQNDKRTDINTANVDGLTALHQACIDDNLEMVEFLVEHGADIDVCDNEGWTPLHATASCAFLDIARYLIKHNANVAAVNNDGDLPIDIADNKEMERLLQEEMNRQGIDAEAARNEEEQRMLEDANQWLADKTVKEVQHPKTGATALHVAAAKGYLTVINLLLKAGVDINAEDYDGWTPLHAAVHWDQKEAVAILVEHLCDMHHKNKAGHTVFDLAEGNMLQLLKELRDKQASIRNEQEKGTDIILSSIHGEKRRSSVTRMSGTQKHQRTSEEERASVRPGRTDDRILNTADKIVDNIETEHQNNDKNKQHHQLQGTSVASTSSATSWSPTSVATSPSVVHLRRLTNGTASSATSVEQQRSSGVATPTRSDALQSPFRVAASISGVELQQLATSTPSIPTLPANVSTPNVELQRSPHINSSVIELRHSSSVAASTPGLRLRRPASVATSTPILELDKQNVSTTKTDYLPSKPATSLVSEPRPSSLSSSVSVRQVNNNDMLVQSWQERARPREQMHRSPHILYPIERLDNNRASEGGTLSTTRTRTPSTQTSTDTEPRSSYNFGQSYTGYRSPFANRSNTYVPYYLQRQQRESQAGSDSSTSSSDRSPASEPGNTTTSTTTTTTSAPTSASTTITTPISVFRRSYEPPKRDEETETQRKARAKHARQTRRSTQGVSLEDIEKAEESISRGKADASPAEYSPATPNKLATTKAHSVDNGEVATTATDVKEDRPLTSTYRRRASEDKSEFASPSVNRGSYRRAREDRDVNLTTTTTTTTSTITNTTDITSNYIPRSQRISAYQTSESTTTVPANRSSLRPSALYASDLTDKASARTESESTTSKEKKEERKESSSLRARRQRKERRSTGIGLESEDGEANGDKDTDVDNNDDTDGSDQLGSHSDSRLQRTASSVNNSDIVYKKKYEEQKNENEKLRKELEETTKGLAEMKLELDRFIRQKDANRSGDRDKRTLERKFSEMEEELKKLETLKADNQRLKDENGALIRVISKLSK